MPILLPLPSSLPLSNPPDDPSKLTAWLKDFRDRYQQDRDLLHQNVNRLSGPDKTDKKQGRPDYGHGMVTNALTNLPMFLGNHGIKVNLLRANSGRAQITVTFQYLGVGEFLLGNGGTTTFTADITVAGANGLDTGAEAANTWYALYVIAGDGGGTVFDSTANNLQPPNHRRATRQATLLSLSATAPTLPSGYTRFRRIGWVRNNNNSDLFRFYDLGDWIVWNESFKDNTASVTNGDFYYTTATPAGTMTAQTFANVLPSTASQARYHAYCSKSTTGSIGIYARPTGANWVLDFSTQVCESGIASRDVSAWFSVPTDTSQSMDYAVTSGVDLLWLFATGYYDPV